MKQRKLGRVQRGVLEALREHGSWGQYHGWLWDTASGTERRLKALVKRGLAEVVPDTDPPVYRITQAGRDALEALEQEQEA